MRCLLREWLHEEGALLLLGEKASGPWAGFFGKRGAEQGAPDIPSHKLVLQERRGVGGTDDPTTQSLERRLGRETETSLGWREGGEVRAVVHAWL